MGSAKRKKLPEGRVYAPEPSVTSTTIQSFDGITAIREHLDHIDQLKEYFCARTKVVPEIPLTCYSECQVAQWMHSETVKECANRKLIEAACERCKDFHAIASQSVLLTKRDLPEPATQVLQSALDFQNASKDFQTALADLYVECKLNQ